MITFQACADPATSNYVHWPDKPFNKSLWKIDMKKLIL